MKYEVKFATGPRTEIALTITGKDVEEMQQLLDAAVDSFRGCVYDGTEEEPNDDKTKDFIATDVGGICARTNMPCMLPSISSVDCRVCRMTKDTGPVNLSHHVCMGCVSRRNCPHRAKYQGMVAEVTARMDRDTGPYGTQVAPYEIHIRCKHFKLLAPIDTFGVVSELLDVTFRDGEEPIDTPVFTDCTDDNIFWDHAAQKYICTFHEPNVECNYREYIGHKRYCTIGKKLKEEAGE